jgi:hypothetical protein
MTIIRVCIEAKLQRADEATCRKFGKPLGTYELLNAHGWREAWIDGNLSLAAAKSEAHDCLAEPLLRDFYCLDTITE